MDLERSMVFEQIFLSTTFAVNCFRYNQSGKKPKQNKTKPKTSQPANQTTAALPLKKQQTNSPNPTQILDLSLLFQKQVCRSHTWFH